MTLGSAYGATVSGYWDKFDAISGYLDQLIERLNALDAEDAAEMNESRIVDGAVPLVDGFFGTEAAPHVETVDVRAELIEKLTEARRQISDACTLAQTTEAALPD